jgi:hypothetical protein
MRSISVLDEGFQILVSTTPAGAGYCVGANAHWVGDDMHIAFVSAQRGEVVPVTNPSVDVGSGIRSIKFSDAQVPAGRPFRIFLDDGTSDHQIGGWTRPTKP